MRSRNHHTKGPSGRINNDQNLLLSATTTMAFGSFRSFFSLSPYCTCSLAHCLVCVVCCVAMHSFCCEHWAHEYVLDVFLLLLLTLLLLLLLTLLTPSENIKKYTPSCEGVTKEPMSRGRSNKVQRHAQTQILEVPQKSYSNVVESSEHNLLFSL